MIGLPTPENGGVTEWVHRASRNSTLYVGSERVENTSDTSSEAPITQRQLATAPPTRSERFNVLVLLEGSKDAATALVFKDIAEIVHDGLQSLGHETRIVYCKNLSEESCFTDEEIVVVLAPHVLASYFTTQGGLVAMERNLVPADAGDTFDSGRCCSRSRLRLSLWSPHCICFNALTSSATSGTSRRNSRLCVHTFRKYSDTEPPHP